MPSTTDYGDFAAGKLAARLASGTTSGATVSVQSVNGAAITWPTGAHRAKLYRKTRTGITVETVGVASASQSGSTVTLGTLTRQLSLTDGATFSSGGNGYTFPAGSEVYITWDVFDAERTMKDDKVNTITGAGAIRGSSTTVPIIRYNNVTEAQRDAMSAANGDAVYNTTTNRLNTYEGGAWGAAGSTTVADGSADVAGKFEEGTVAEQGSATATGGTGARLVPAVANLVKTSSGSGDENKIAVLNASGVFAPGFLGTGTPSASTALTGANTWVSTGALSKFFGDASDGAITWSVNTNLDPTAVYNYSTATLDATKTLSVSSVNSVLVVASAGDTAINGTIDLNSKGGAGGAGGAGASSASTSGTAGTAGTSGTTLISGYVNASGGAGGGGGFDGTNGGGGGGGGGGCSQISDTAAATAGSAAGGAAGGSAGSASTTLAIKNLVFLLSIMRGVSCGAGGTGGGGGGKGGGGAAGSAGAGGAGGAGGGAMVWFIGGNLTLGASSVIRCSGDAGTNGSNSPGNQKGGGGGGGGGGAGCVVIVVAGSITNNGVTLTADGGAAGTGGTNGGFTGAGPGGGAAVGTAGKIIIYSISDGTVIAS